MLRTTLLGLVLLLTSCAHSPQPVVVLPPIEPTEDVLVWSKALNRHIPEWQLEFEKHLNVRPVMVFCHGIDIRGDWWLWPDAPLKPARVEDVAQTLHTVYPGRVIVLICCDTGKFKLHVPGVYYCRKYDAVWDRPGARFYFSLLTGEFDVGGGFFEDFEQGGP